MGNPKPQWTYLQILYTQNCSTPFHSYLFLSFKSNAFAVTAVANTHWLFKLLLFIHPNVLLYVMYYYYIFQPSSGMYSSLTFTFFLCSANAPYIG
jgi:hypothetical protein